MAKKKGLLALIGLLGLAGAISASVFATTNASTGVTVSGTASIGSVTAGSSYVQASGPALKYTSGSSGSYANVAPSWTPVANSGGSITAGDLYQIDLTNIDASSTAMIRLMQTNAPALDKNYSYLLQQVNVYSTSQATPAPGDWSQATLADGSAIGTVYMTLSDSVAEFLVAGGSKYNISVEGGTFYAVDTDASGGSLSPAFFLSVE